MLHCKGKDSGKEKFIATLQTTTQVGILKKRRPILFNQEYELTEKVLI